MVDMALPDTSSEGSISEVDCVGRLWIAHRDDSP